MPTEFSTDKIFWVDLEMTGLDPEHDRIIEMASILTDGDLNVLAEGPELVIHQPTALLEGMDDWNQKHHGESGLIERVKDATLTEAEAERETLQFLQENGCPKNAVPLAGNSVHHDRRFMRRYLPRLDQFLHYRIIDTSSLKELVSRWYPADYDHRPAKRNQHRALDDIRESIEELAYYRRTVFRQP